VGTSPLTCVLTVNAGSSSLKLGLWRGERALASAKAEELGGKGALSVDGAALRGRAKDHASALHALLAPLMAIAVPQAVGHRLVHGGPALTAPALVDAPLMRKLRALVPLAPLHMPSELALIEAARSLRLPQVVCFDTAFHRTLPAHASVLPLPKAMRDAGLRRYGFHGLSYESLALRLPRPALRRAIFCHLGSGSSMTAVRGGVSVDTTMGFTPTGGIMMGTRPGDLDPGMLLHWLRAHPALPSLEHALEKESGLLGVSESSSDMRKLLARKDARARLAVAMYCYRVKLQIGAYHAALGGLDTLVFTGGIGERAHEVRARACAGLEALGIVLDARANRRGEGQIGRGRVAVHVIAADEERMLARHTRETLRAAGRA
jgi:acetate kinase